VTIDTVMRVVPFGTPSSGSFDVRGTRKYSVCFQNFLLKSLFEKKISRLSAMSFQTLQRNVRRLDNLLCKLITYHFESLSFVWCGSKVQRGPRIPPVHTNQSVCTFLLFVCTLIIYLNTRRAFSQSHKIPKERFSTGLPEPAPFKGKVQVLTCQPEPTHHKLFYDFSLLSDVSGSLNF
jgi:hypothetical protein